MINEISSSNNSDSFESDIVMPSNPEPTGLQMGFSYTSVFFQPTGPQAGPSHVPPSMFMGPQMGPSFVPPSMFLRPQVGPLHMPFPMHMQAEPPPVPPSMFEGPQAEPSHIPPSMFLGPQTGPVSSIYMQAAEMQAGPSHMYHQQGCTHMPQPSMNYAIDTNIQPDTNSQSDIDEESKAEVTGYTKPPQDHMPEIIDLAGSDSNPTQLVGPELNHHQPHPHGDSVHEWNQSRCRRRRRSQHISDDSTTSAASRSTPEERSDQPIVPLYMHITAASDSSSDDNTRGRARSRRRVIRFAAHRPDKRVHHRDTRNTHHRDSDKRYTRKSRSSKSIKSYNNNAERGFVPATATTSSSTSVAQPTVHKSSRERKRRHGHSREMRNITSQRDIEESNSNNLHLNIPQLQQTPQLANCKTISDVATVQSTVSRPSTHGHTLPHVPPNGDADSTLSDCIPLNLTIHRRNLDGVPLNLTLQKRKPTSM